MDTNCQISVEVQTNSDKILEGLR